MKVKSERRSCLVVSDSSRPHGLQPTRLLHPWDFPGKRGNVIFFFLFVTQIETIVYKMNRCLKISDKTLSSVYHLEKKCYSFSF